MQLALLRKQRIRNTLGYDAIARIIPITTMSSEKGVDIVGLDGLSTFKGGHAVGARLCRSSNSRALRATRARPHTTDDPFDVPLGPKGFKMP